MHCTLIAAMTPDGVIGDDGMPWHLPRDLKRFRELTWGKPLIMGRKTFELFGKPLPGRPHIVLTHRRDYRAAGCHVANDVPAALRIAGRLIDQDGPGLPVGEVMVIGGGEVYRLLIDVADRIYLTTVHAHFAGTARFPIDRLQAIRWKRRFEQRFDVGDDNPIAHTFCVLERIR